ncbi:gamma-glutamylcyclotransferase family protein [Streptomyces sp. NPDC003717]|uniref:gamma-glutamylcyclotransferase family protein n=1 Tax=Streptomyces sp. NPDC003717 TaxID=3154276 RepID=UPI0033A849A4
MTPLRLPFFVYGTLRPGGSNHHLVRPALTGPPRPARLPGAVLYAGPGYPFALDDPHGTVTGDFLTPDPAAYGDLLAALDHLEEYVPGDPANLYDRVPRTVTLTADARPARAWTYLAAPATASRLRRHGERIGGDEWRP